MQTRYVIPLGTSEPQDFELRNNGVAINGTGYAIGIEVARFADGAVIGVPAPSIAWLVQAAGTVRVTGVEAFVAGNYLVRFRLTDGSSKIAYVPNGEHADLWLVVPVANP